MTPLRRKNHPPLRIPPGTSPVEMDRLLTAHQRGDGPLFRRLAWRPAEGAPPVIGVDPGQKGALDPDRLARYLDLLRLVIAIGGEDEDAL